MSDHPTAKRYVELLLASTHFFPTHGGAQLRFLRYIPGLGKRGIFTRVLAGTAKSKKRPEAPRAAAMGNEDSALSEEFLDQIDIERVALPQRAGWPRSVVFSRAILRSCDESGGSNLATFTPTEAPPPVTQPAIGASPTSFSFTATQGGAKPTTQTLSISNTGSGTLSWTTTDNVPWMTLSRASAHTTAL